MKHGDITKIARKAGITPSYMAFILKGQRRPSKAVAEKLELATGVSAEAWIFPEKNHNPLLKSKTDAPTQATTC